MGGGILMLRTSRGQGGTRPLHGITVLAVLDAEKDCTLGHTVAGYIVLRLDVTVDTRHHIDLAVGGKNAWIGFAQHYRIDRRHGHVDKRFLCFMVAAGAARAGTYHKCDCGQCRRICSFHSWSRNVHPPPSAL